MSKCGVLPGRRPRVQILRSRRWIAPEPLPRCPGGRDFLSFCQNSGLARVAAPRPHSDEETLKHCPPANRPRRSGGNTALCLAIRDAPGGPRASLQRADQHPAYRKAVREILFTASGTGVVAGYAGVSSAFVCAPPAALPDGGDGIGSPCTLTWGGNGGLPGGQPIEFELLLEPPPGDGIFGAP